MIQSEMIMASSLNDSFHKHIELLTDINPASVVQSGRRPRAKLAYPLAYFKAFVEPAGDTSQVQALLGLLHFGMLSVGPEYEMSEVTGYPHGLHCLQGNLSRRGLVGVIVTGEGEQWATAIRNAGDGPPSVREWGVSCYKQFAKHDLSDLMGSIKPKSGGGYFLESI